MPCAFPCGNDRSERVALWGEESSINGEDGSGFGGDGLSVWVLATWSVGLVDDLEDM